MKFPLLKKNRSKNNLHIVSDIDLITKNPDPSLSEAFKSARINLIYTLAQTEAKVLLIGFDLRKPRMHTYLGVKNKEGLANHLGGFSSIDSQGKKPGYSHTYSDYYYYK